MILRSSGIAVISFDFSFVFTCPKTMLFSDAHALTMHMGDSPKLFDPLRHFPSIEIKLSIFVVNVRTHLTKHC